MKRFLVLSAIGFVMAACGGGSSGGSGAPGGGSSDVAFHAEAPVLPDFSYDTGLVPASGPAQVSMKLAATGSLVADTAASRDGGKLVGKPGAGTYKLDMHVKLEGHLKVDAGAVTYDGDFPGLKNVDIPIGGTSPFDGLLLDGDPTKVNADVPETKLPDIPLGSVPGHLSLTIASGTHITSTFHGSCLGVKGGQATLAGTTSTSGTIVLHASIVLDIPLYKKSIDLPPFTIDVPAANKELDSAPAKVDGVDDATAGACGAPPAGSGSSGSSGGGSSSGGSSSGGSSGSSGGSSSGGSSGSSGGSSSGDVDGGDGGGGSTATVSIDGNALTVQSAAFFQMQWSTAQLIVKVAGAGIPDGTDLLLDLTSTGGGCSSAGGGQDIWYRHGAPDYDQFVTSATPDCGLTVTSLPASPGDHATGAFHGDLQGLNQAQSLPPAHLDLTFDIVR